jgi:YebC/PmpR family DNA-binding regulatory protein
VADSKKGALFTKAGKNITIAAKEGADPELNFKLKMAIAEARTANMPKENIERAIKRGTGEGNEAILEEAVYEGYGPSGVAIIITAITDNLKRTVSDIRGAFTKHGNAMADSGSVLWGFEQKGAIRINLQNIKKEEIELTAIDAGADDIETEDQESLLILTKVKNLKNLKESLEKSGAKIESAQIEYISKTKIKLSKEDEKKLEKLIEAITELDDVNEIYTNAE